MYINWSINESCVNQVIKCYIIVRSVLFASLFKKYLRFLRWVLIAQIKGCKIKALILINSLPKIANRNDLKTPEIREVGTVVSHIGTLFTRFFIADFNGCKHISAIVL